MSAIAKNVASDIRAAKAELPDARAAAREAAGRIAPLWPLQNFVAVNPFIGVLDKSFVEAGRLFAQADGARLTLPREQYFEALNDGRIDDRDLERAIAELGDALPAGLHAAQARSLAARDEITPARLRRPTVVGVAQRLTGIAFERLMIDSVSAWAADFYDQGSAQWRETHATDDPYAAWRESMLREHHVRWRDVPGFAASLRALPETHDELLTFAAEKLAVDAGGLVDYFHRLLCDVAGWAGHARYLEWHRELNEQAPSAARRWLAIRLAFECIFLNGFGDDRLGLEWARRRADYATDESLQWLNHRAVDHVLHVAYEYATARRVLPPFNSTAPVIEGRPALQAAFCIDVRSERLRRALEAQSDSIETIGFAGFFGLPLKHTHATDQTQQDRAPVLLTPPIESRIAQSPGQVAGAKGRAAVSQRWSRFRSAAVSCFGYVEALGPTYAAKLARATLKRVTPGCSAAHTHRARPTAGLELDMSLAERLDAAEGLLRGMSLTRRFAPIVLLVGHGSSSTNNPYASGLDCGACGGHAGDVNARAAAQILNDEDVRVWLIERGIAIPTDTIFVPALHDTTTDEVVTLGGEAVHENVRLAKVADWLSAASEQVRDERAPTLGEKGGPRMLRQLQRRARDWSQVRPEWGLAGCAAFVAAPRYRTRGLNFDGRSFLHCYDWRHDKDFAVLETILTAPLVVASWISLQYFGSTVDNRAFGSGNKTLHNVVAGLGVFEGSGGDLRSGLPWQSVHDGERYIHEPVRLSAFVEAPTQAIETVLERHETLRNLVNNRWIRLHAIADTGMVLARDASGTWTPES